MRIASSDPQDDVVATLDSQSEDGKDALSVNLIAIRPRKRKWSPITLTATQGNLTFILGIIVFPGLVILAGFRVWWKRRSL